MPVRGLARCRNVALIYAIAHNVVVAGRLCSGCGRHGLRLNLRKKVNIGRLSRGNRGLFKNWPVRLAATEQPLAKYNTGGCCCPITEILKNSWPRSVPTTSERNSPTSGVPRRIVLIGPIRPIGPMRCGTPRVFGATRRVGARAQCTGRPARFLVPTFHVGTSFFHALRTLTRGWLGRRASGNAAPTRSVGTSGQRTRRSVRCSFPRSTWERLSRIRSRHTPCAVRFSPFRL